MDFAWAMKREELLAQMAEDKREMSNSSCGDGSFEYRFRREAEDRYERFSNALLAIDCQVWQPCGEYDGLRA